MQTSWLWILTLLLIGWVLVDGAVHGAAMTLYRVEPGQRRGVLTGIGPFLLAGEVWLVAAAGALLGVFPGAEHDLLGVAYPVVVALVAGWITRDAGIWFRSRLTSRRWQATWERAAGIGAVIVAGAWGLLSAAVVRGLPAQADVSPGRLLEPYSLLWGAFMIAAFAAHGAAFVAARAPMAGKPGSGDASAVTVARVLRRRRALIAAGLGAAVAATTPVLVEASVRPVAIAALVVGAGFLVVPAVLTTVGDRAALALTGSGLAMAVLAVVVQADPWIRTGAAADQTLNLLGVVLFPVVVVMIGVQVWTAWLFRRRVDDTSAVFY